MKFRNLPLTVLCIFFAACSNLHHPTHRYPTGLGSEKRPVRCGGVSGAEAYLNRLIDPGGARVIYYRVGNYGAGPDGHPLVGYVCRIGNGEKPVLLHMDLHHPAYQEKRAPRGFKLAPAPH